MIEALEGESRLVLDVRLAPVAGSTFQPTGFPDLGAATFQRPGQPPSLIVESVQSMANRLEAVGWNGPEQQPHPPLETLPYLRIEAAEDGAFLTSSRLEPHRLAAAYVRDAQIDGSKGVEWIAARLALRPGRPLDWPHIYRAIFELDPLCLLHGVFFSDPRWSGNPKVRRAITAVVEAHDVAPVVSGGLKRDDVAVKSTPGRGSREGYGFVPFGRTEWTAREIELTLVVDLGQIRGYGLGAEGERLLTLLALWEASTLLAEPLRLRTACDLDMESMRARRPDGFSLPKADELASEIAAVAQPAQHGPVLGQWPAPDVKKPEETAPDPSEG
jgi:CRISPR-associated protein Csb1